MNLQIGACTAAERPGLIAALDREFVAGRGRAISLAERFPAAFAPAASKDLRVLRPDGRIAACLLVQRFDWMADGVLFRGAMIGMVYTAPECRGQGFARRLLEGTIAELRTEGRDFAVLWSSLAGYYERLGWRRADCSRFGVLERSGAIGPAPHADPRALAPATLEGLEALRTRLLHRRVVRAPVAYRSLPLPAERLCCTRAGRGSGREAYILYGVRADAVFIYELLGATAAYSELWGRAIQGAAAVYVNDAADTPSANWLRTHTALALQPQALALWQMLSPRAAAAPYAQWHIPYFDRI